MEKYAELVSAPPTDNPPSVAVVGGGLAGATCARILRDHGLEVDTFDKGRGPGGRMSTRRADLDGERDFHFDHGAQYFTARDERFRRFVDAWCDRGVADRWEGRFAVLEEGEVTFKEGDAERFVGVPKMNAVVAHLAEGAGVQFGVRVGGVERRGGEWILEGGDGEELGSWDALVMTPPAEQTAELLAGVDTPLREIVDRVSTQPTWAVMLGFDAELPVDFDAAFVHDSPLAWVARNSAKPGRPAAESWVLHSTHVWAEEHVERDFAQVAAELTDIFLSEIGLVDDHPTILHRQAHRWRYAEAVPPMEEGALYDAGRSLVVAGDWVNGSRIEGAFLSGCAAAGRVLVP